MASKARSRVARSAGLVGCLLLIGVWQASFALIPSVLDPQFRVEATSGLDNFKREYSKGFVYFYYYTGLFPVTSMHPLEFSEEGARRIIRDHGDSLRMEVHRTIHAGEMGKMLLFLPWACLKGTPADPSVRPFHSFLFAATLMLLFWSFWRLGHGVLGAFVVLFSTVFVSTASNARLFSDGAALFGALRSPTPDQAS